MRFATRTFLVSFVPYALLLTASFWAIQKLVELTVRDELRTSLRQTHASIARVRAKSELQNSRFLKVVGENASLKAGLQLLLSERNDPDARLTMEEQLRDICGTLGFDFLVISNANGIPLAGILRIDEQLVAMDLSRLQPPLQGFLSLGERTYQVASTPLDQGEENLGLLSLGERFDFSDFTTPAVFTRHEKVLKSSIPGIGTEEVESALKGCKAQAECEVRLRGETYISLPMESIYFGEGYLLRSLQSVDSASRPVQAILRNVFLVTGFCALMAALLLTVVSSRSIVRPIGAVVAYLRESARTGLMPEFHEKVANIQEIRELAESFNRAAAAIRQGRENLHRAYVEFAGSLASALDARDRYTAGHSRRVSEISCAIARQFEVSADDLEEIRIGGLLHDIGKIGIADSVLQKPGKLTQEEFAIIQDHPVIGRRILDQVHGLHRYVPIVELHHENWDGSGYPLGLRGEATPLGPRIVHVADAYDAMTTDRPYRSGMSHEEAIKHLERNAGIQFDAAIVDVFVKLHGADRKLAAADPVEAESPSIHRLAEAVHHSDAQLEAAKFEKR